MGRSHKRAPIEDVVDRPPTTCSKCQTIHGKGRCMAHLAGTVRSGAPKPCRRWTNPGSKVCASHGGKAPNVVTAAADRVQTLRVRDAAVDFATPRQIDPAEGLIEEYWRSAGLVSYYERKAQELATLPDGSLVFGVVEEVTEHERVQDHGDDGSTVEALQQLGLADDKGQVETKRKTTKRSAPNVWLQLYKEERTHFAKLGVEIARLGLEARRDEYIRLHMAAFVTVLEAIALTPEQKVKAAAALRAIEGTSVR